MHTVHVRVNDAATGKPTPCRVRFTDAEGRYYAPLGRLVRFDTRRGGDVGGNLLLGGKKYAYIDGACEVALPAGRITVEIHKGFEYTPIRQDVQLAAGKLALRFSLSRWADMRQEGWVSGDAEAYWLSPHAALLEGAAEDLAVVNLLAEQTGPPCDEEETRSPVLPNILAFSGQQPALQRPDCMVVVNTANEHPLLGRLGLLNCHRPVYPLHCGDSGPDGEADDWALADWCDQCHRKGGLAVGQWFCGSVLYPEDRGPFEGSAETLAELILGKVDAIDVKPVDPWLIQNPLREWQILLNAGLCVPLAAGSGKRSNNDQLGAYRTYAHVGAGQELTYKNWIEAVRAGRTFVTNGPLLTLAVNDQQPGASLDLSSASRTVRVSAGARSLRPLERLDVTVNGAVVASAQPTGECPSEARLEADVELPGPCWLAARAACPLERNELQRAAAQTSAIYVRVDGISPRADYSQLAELLAKLDRSLEWVAQEGRCDDKHRQRLAHIFESAKQELLRRQSF